MPYKDISEQREYQRKWIAKRRKDWFDANGPCVLCGSSDDLELDHIDESTKVTHNIWSWSEKRRADELVKCQVLCKICHLEKTKQFGRKLHLGIPNAICRKLSPLEINQMRLMRDFGASFQKISEKFGIHRTNVARMLAW